MVGYGAFGGGDSSNHPLRVPIRLIVSVLPHSNADIAGCNAIYRPLSWRRKGAARAIHADAKRLWNK